MILVTSKTYFLIFLHLFPSLLPFQDYVVMSKYMQLLYLTLFCHDSIMHIFFSSTSSEPRLHQESNLHPDNWPS